MAINVHKIDAHFKKIGSSFKTRPLAGHSMTPGGFRLNVQPGRKGEVFELSYQAPVQIMVLDVKPDEKHLLLHVQGRESRKFLCGHDERHFFVAGVDQYSRDVFDAMHRLQPEPVRSSASKLPRQTRFARSNDVFKRQGEWYFIPAPDVRVSNEFILQHEPIQRGRSKPHLCQWLYRTGGVVVHVHRKHPNGITEDEFNALPEQERKAFGWRRMTRDALVYAKGKVSHPDHATLTLKGWHRVLLNNEVLTEEMAFLD